MKDKFRRFFPQDEAEYQKELEEESIEWDLMRVYYEALSNGFKPDKENKITVVDPLGLYKIEFRAIDRNGKVRKVTMYDKENKVERHFGITNNQRHGLFLEIRNGKVTRMGSYKNNKPYGKLSVLNEETGKFEVISYFE